MESPSRRTWTFERIAAVLVLGLPVAFSGVLFAGMGYIGRRGLDDVDESYLLRIVADPQATRPAGEVYLFGFVLHPIYELMGSDIARLRLLGFVLIAGASAYLCHEALALVQRHVNGVSTAHRWAAMATVAGSSTLVFSDTVTIPAYRYVAILGLAVSAAGLARLGRRHESSGGALLGIGMWTCFVGKPTSAAALVVLVTIFALWFGLVSIRMMASAFAGALVAVSLTLVVARMTPVETVDYLARGVHLEALLGAHPTVPILLGWSPLWLDGLLVFGPLVMGPFVVRRLRESRTRPERRHAEDLWCSVALLLVACLIGWFGARRLGPSGHGLQVMPLALVLPAITLTWLLRDRWASDPVRRPRPGVIRGFVLFVVALPYVSAVGSNLSFTVVMPLATFFWVVAVIVVSLTRPARTQELMGRSALPLVLCLVTAVSGTLWFVSHSDGLDGGALGQTLQPAPVEGGTLWLRPDEAKVASTLRTVARQYHITRETPVVDVTGVGAGYAVMTGGGTIGRAHLYAYLPGSLAAARAALSTATCDQRASAWLIYAPGNWMDLSRAITGDAVSLSADYENVASFRSRQIRGTWDMQLLRPRPSVREKLHC